MMYEVVDTFGNQLVGKYKTREEAIYGIRLYCVQKMMVKVSFFNQDFVNLIETEDEVIYENPIGYYPNKPKFKIRYI